MPTIAAATIAPLRNSFPGPSSTRPTASIPRTCGKWTLGNVELHVEFELFENIVVRVAHRVASDCRLAVWRHEDPVFGVQRQHRRGLSSIERLVVCRQCAFDARLVTGCCDSNARKSANCDQTQHRTQISNYHLLSPLVVSRIRQLMRRCCCSLDAKAGNKISISGKMMTDLNSLLIFATVADANS